MLKYCLYTHTKIHITLELEIRANRKNSFQNHCIKVFEVPSSDIVQVHCCSNTGNAIESLQM